MTIQQRPHATTANRIGGPRLPLTGLSRAAILWSIACAAAGLWWLLDPEAYLLTTADPEAPAGVLPMILPAAASLALVLLGLAGIPLAVGLGRLTRDRAPAPRTLLLAGAAYAVVFGIVVPDVQLFAFLGYATALTAPLLMVGVLAAGVRRYPRNLIPLTVIGTAIAIGVLTGYVGEPTLQMFQQIAAGVDRLGPRPLVLALLVTGGVLFALLTMIGAGHGDRWPHTRAGRARLVGWGRAATWVAAACPLPYGLIRMTWLTPWPQGAPGGPDAIGDGVRVFGILLGLAALGGGVLTIGLIARWGEVFPAWLPLLRGRPVPVMAAVVPATAVSATLCGSAVSMVMMAVGDGSGWLIAAIPVPVWGPALALATYAYYRRRTDSDHPSET